MSPESRTLWESMVLTPQGCHQRAGSEITTPTDPVSLATVPRPARGHTGSFLFSGDVVFNTVALPEAGLTSELTISSGTLCTMDTVAVDRGTCCCPFLLCNLHA